MKTLVYIFLFALTMALMTSTVRGQSPLCECKNCDCGSCDCGFAYKVTDCRFQVINRTAKKLPSTAQFGDVRIHYRQPVGHTHTCPRCGTTWDHLANSSHNCPKCGTAQYVQDSRPHQVQVQTVTAPPSTVKTEEPLMTFQSFGGCANGSCGAAQAPQRRGLFSRR